MIQSLTKLSQQRRYWLALLSLGILLEGVGLYYQYQLNEWPCVLCIHVRISVLGFVLISLIAVFCKPWPDLISAAHGLCTIVMAVLVERSWRVLAVERGWIFGDCDMDAGLPPWLALDQWFPSMFEVQAACGYSPIILFDISMAEVLMPLSVLLLLLSVTLFALSWSNR